MSSLRHLLGTDFKSEMDIYGQVPSPLHDGKVVMYNYGHDCCCWDCGWNGQRRHMWCAPLGTCRITFEAWGGSGGAASSCCCAMSTGGTTGAYVRKTVCGSLAGNCYCICIGRVEGGNGDVTSKRGCRGCWTTICGRGVHMCAEGGYGGCAICNLVQPAGSGSYHGQSRIVLFDNATQPDNCVEFGPQGYGGDLNVRGRTGWFRYHCDDNCSVFWHIPSPPYLGHLASCSYVATKHCQQNTCAYFYMKSSYGGFTGAVGATSNYFITHQTLVCISTRTTWRTTMAAAVAATSAATTP